MATPPKPTQFEGDIGRLIPELEQTGPNDTISVGQGGGSRDDLVPRYKKTMRDFLKSIQTNQLDGNKRDETTPFADATTLVEHDRGKFFNRSVTVDINGVIDDITTDLTAEEILRAIRGLPNTTVPQYHDSATPDNSKNVQNETSPLAKNVITATNTVLSNNRFSPNKPYMVQGARVADFAAVPAGLGIYKRDSIEQETMTKQQLEKIGVSLMLRATGEFIQGDPTSAGVSLASLLPGQAQLGIPIESKTMYARDAFGAPGENRSKIPEVNVGGDDVLGAGAGFGFGSNIFSYGQLNSVNEPFAGFLPIGMIALSILLIVAWSAIVLGLSALFTIGSDPSDKKTVGEKPSDLQFGSYNARRKKTKYGVSTSFISLSDIGIVDVKRNFSLAVREGISVFFDLESAPGAAASFKRITKSPGYYVNLVRTIIRSTARLIMEVIDAFKQLATNPVAGAQQVLGIVDLLKSSKLIAFVNIMAQLGAQSLSMKEREDEVNKVLSPWHSTSRMPESRDDKRRLTWNMVSAPAAMLLPQSIVTLQTKTSTGKDYTTTNADLLRYQSNESELKKKREKEKDKTRFSHEFVKLMEDELEAQYVPFYFQDLRTNEIISFHAFIDDVSEQFAPTYNSVAPFGRVDPVMSYTNTTRTFSLSFKVVATDESDLKAMYAKLNKFVTFVYPQWTAGRQVQDSDGLKFRQPFSQVQGASPLIRIRLGDLIKTNFSNPALARLFGAGEKDAFDLTNQTEAREGIRSVLDRLGFRPGQSVVYTGPINRDVIMTILRDAFANTPSILPDPTDENAILLVNEWINKAQKCTILRPSAVPKSVFVKLDGPEFQAWDPVAFSVENLRHSEDEVDKLIPLVGSLFKTTYDEFFDFDGDKNAVVRSFKNTAGRGLAGFITSLSMAWNDAVMAGKWNIDRGSSAPMFCKIQIAFTVIHDIQPGLDSDGFNRAPLYDIAGANPYK